MTDKYETLLNNTFLISAGTLGSKLITFFMVRFYTDVLTPADYGTADIIVQTANLLLPLVSMGMVEAVFRFALNDPLGRKNVFSAGAAVISAGALLLAGVCCVLFSLSLFRDTVWLIALYTIASCYHSLCAQFVRAQGKTALFAAQGLLNTLLVVGLNILFLAVFQWGITGYVMAVVLADLLCSLFLLFKERLWRYVTIHPEKEAFRQMFRYGVPLIPTTVFWWITSVSDRYMITGFLGSDANGLYAVACKIPTMLTLVAGIFLEAWYFSAIRETGESKSTQIHFYSRVWSAFMGVMFLAGSLVAAFSKLEISLLAADEYYKAWQYIPLLSAAMVFSSFVTFMGSIYAAEKRSFLSFWTAMAGAVINVALNLALISPLGIQGAAAATLVSYMTVFLLRAKNARRIVPFRLYKKRLAAGCLVFLVQILFLLWEAPGWQIAQGVCPAVLLMVNGRPLITAAGKMRAYLPGGR